MTETQTTNSTAQRLWQELAAMVARARQQERWDLMFDGHAQDLETAETALRETRAELGQ